MTMSTPLARLSPRLNRSRAHAARTVSQPGLGRLGQLSDPRTVAWADPACPGCEPLAQPPADAPSVCESTGEICTASVSVNGVQIKVKKRLIADAAAVAPAKDLARETAISASRLYQLRSGRFGVGAEHLIALAQLHPPLARAVEAALSGAVDGGTPQALDDIFRRLRP